MAFGLFFGLRAWSLTLPPVADEYRRASVSGLLWPWTAFNSLR
jgi:hypothetical protein